MFKMIKDMFATFRRQKQVCVPSHSCAVSELRASAFFYCWTTRSWLKRLETPDVRVQELDVIRAQRLKLQSQMETFKADSAEQLRQQEEQTLAMLEKVVERLQTERGRLLTDQRLMQVRSTS